jgi:hypothetical protein
LIVEEKTLDSLKRIGARMISGTLEDDNVDGVESVEEEDE